MDPWILRNGKEIRPLDWIEKQQIDRDICLLYHQLAEYSSIMGDLYYGNVFALPYWNYLEISNLPHDDFVFIRDGCLVMMLAMAWDVLDGSGNYLAQEDRLSKCLSAVERIEYDEISLEDERTQRLIVAVRTALQHTKSAQKSTDDMERDSAWAHREFVRGYFKRKAQQFEKDPYYS